MKNIQFNSISEEYSSMENITKKYVLVPTFKKLVGDVRGKLILDLACGAGYFTRILANDKPTELIGIDISEELINKASEIENRNNLGISYKKEDVLKLELNKKYDLITAVYLLNYAKTKNELLLMCKKIYSLLKDGGKFATITTNPMLIPMKKFEYGRKFTNVSGNDSFYNGDKVRVEIKYDNNPKFEFINYYWSKKTYEECLTESGFYDISWVNSIVSQEGINKYGNEFWNNFKNNPSPIGLVCLK